MMRISRFKLLLTAKVLIVSLLLCLMAVLLLVPRNSHAFVVVHQQRHCYESSCGVSTRQNYRFHHQDHHSYYLSTNPTAVCARTSTNDLNDPSRIKHDDVGSNRRRHRLRQRLINFTKTAFVALTIQRAAGVATPAYASSSWTPFRGKPSIMIDKEPVIKESEHSPEAVPDDEHPSSTSLPKVSNEKFVPPAEPQITLKDFERFRNADTAIVKQEEAQTTEAGEESSVLTSESEKRRKKKFEQANAKRKAGGGGGKQQDSVRLKRQSKRKSQVTDQTKNSKIFQVATPIAGVSFLTITFIRNKIRMDRERAFVEDNIEKLEQQKAEYFNVTGQALSDDDLMESLRMASGNMTVSDDDMDEDDDDEYEDDDDDDDDDDDEYEYVDDDEDDDDDEED